MAYVKQEGKNKFNMQKFSIHIYLQTGIRKRIKILAKDCDEAEQIARHLEAKLRVEKEKIIRKRYLTSDEVACLEKYLESQSKKYN